MIETLKKNKIINVLGLAIVFLFTERTLRSLFLFSCTYRMQTVHSIAFIFCSWLIIAVCIFKLRTIPAVPCAYVAVYLGYLLATVVNNGDFQKWADILIYSIPPMLLVSLMKDRKELYLRVGVTVFSAAAFLNLLFLFFPVLYSVISEWDEQYFMGYHTFVGWALTLGVCFALLDLKVSGRKSHALIYMVLYFVNILLVYTGGAKIGAMIIALYLVFPFVRKFFKKCRFIYLLLAVVLLFGLLMWCFEPFVNFPPVKALVENVLHRDITLSGRLYVWKGALERTLEKPFLGHGLSESSQIFFESSSWNQAMVHAHNAFLQTWYEGGLVTLVLALGMMVFSGRKLKENDIGGITKMVLFAFLVMMQNDLDVYYTWYAVALISHMGITFGNDS